MGAINMWLAILVYRLAFRENIPSPTDNVWDCFPFNNIDFCRRVGIRDATVGLSLPPVGEVGEHLSQTTRDEWESHVAGAIRFLRWLDSDMRRWFEEWTPTVNAKNMTKKKAKEKEDLERETLDEKGAPLDRLQAGWACNAVSNDKADWEWLISETFGGPAGMFRQLRDLMHEHNCDAETAHQYKRDTVKAKAERDGIPFREADVQTKTAFDQFWSEGRRGISLAIFGTSIIRHRVPDDKKVRVARALCYRLFENDVRSLVRAVKKTRDTEDKLDRAYTAALADGSVGNFRHMYRLLGEILRVQRVCGVDLTIDKGTWKDKIDKMMAERGRIIRDGKVEKVTITREIVSDEVMDQVMGEYVQVLRARQAQELVNEPNDAQPDLADLPDLAEGDTELWNSAMQADAGVLRWGKSVLDDLFSLIGLENGNVFGRPEGSDKNGRWHQWVAVIEMVRRSFTSKIGQEGYPTLLADQVGLGKTIEVVLYIQVIWHLQQLQRSNPNWPEVGENTGYKFWPKLLGVNKYFMGRKTIPDSPILLVVPRTLVDQWSITFREWLDPRTYNLLEFTGNEINRKAFFTSDEFKSATVHASHTIILAHNSAVAKEGRRCLHVYGDRNAGDPATGAEKEFSGSLFDRDWLLGIIEEAHTWRNPGIAGDALTTLMARCAQRIALTATPIFTHPRDLLQLGRLLRVPAFIGDKGRVISQTVKSAVANEMKEWKADSEHKELKAFLRGMRKLQSGGESEEVLSARVEDFILSRKGAIQSFRSFWTSRFVMDEILREFDEVLIRRDERSNDPAGNPLLNLLPKHTVISWLKLGDKTKEALAQQTSTDERIDSGRADLTGFFTRVKQILVHPDLEDLLDEIARMREEKKAEKRGKSPSARSSESESFETDVDRYAEKLFPDLAAYEANPSEKLDRMIEIATHHIGEDNRNSGPLAWSPDGKKIPSPMPANPGEADEPKRKIVIYCHLAASWALAKRVLHLKGFKSVSVNGRMSLIVRNKAVRDFQAVDGPDIMLLSNVGSTGLNLFRGSVCVFVDHPWSASEQIQIEGRLQRSGQTRQVYIYRLVAPDTADEFLLGYASGKMLMMQVFTRECQVQRRDTKEKFADDDPDRTAETIDDDDDDDDDPPAPVPSTSKMSARQPKAASKPESEPESESAPDPAPKPRRRPPIKPPPAPAPAAAPIASTSHISTASESATLTVPGQAGPLSSSASPAPPSPVAGPSSEFSAPIPDLEQWDLKPGQVPDGQVHPAYPHLGAKPIKRGTKGDWSKSVNQAISAHRKELKAAGARQAPKIVVDPTKAPPARQDESDVEMEEPPRIPKVLVPATQSTAPQSPGTIIADSQRSPSPSQIPATYRPKTSGMPRLWDSQTTTHAPDRLSQDFDTLGIAPGASGSQQTASQAGPNVGDKRAHPSPSPEHDMQVPFSRSPSPPPSAQRPREPEDQLTDADLDEIMRIAAGEQSRAECSTPIGAFVPEKLKRARRG